MDWTFFFFFSSRRRHTRLQGDWSSDVCSSDLSRGGCGIPSLENLLLGIAGAAVGSIAPHQVRPVENTPAAIEMLADQHAAVSQRATPFGLLNLQRAVVDAHGVVLVDHAVVLQRKNALQILSRGGHKGALRLRR